MSKTMTYHDHMRRDNIELEAELEEKRRECVLLEAQLEDTEAELGRMQAEVGKMVYCASEKAVLNQCDETLAVCDFALRWAAKIRG